VAAAGALAAGAVAMLAAFSSGPAPARHAHRIARLQPAREARTAAVVKKKASRHRRPHRHRPAAPVTVEKTVAPIAPRAVPNKTPATAAPQSSFDPRFYGK
jgi:hypothetical protein